MSLTKCTTPVDNITKIGTSAFDRKMTTPGFKAEFDKSVTGIKEFLNDTLIPELESSTPGASGADKIGSNKLKENGTETVRGQLKELYTDKVDKIPEKGLSANDFTDELKTSYNQAVANSHSHSNKTLLDTYKQTEINLSDAVDKKHSHAKTDNEISDAVDKKHAHSKSDTEISDTVDKKHSHTNKAELDKILTIEKAMTNTDNAVPTSKAVLELMTEVGGGDMLSNVYDPQKKKTDIYAYADMYSDGTHKTGSIIQLDKTKTFDYLDLNILANTIVTPTNPSLPISPDNPQYEVSVGGVNLFDGQLERGGYDKGVKVAWTDVRSSNKFPIQPSTSYTLSNSRNDTNGIFVWFDKGGNFISNSSGLVNQRSPQNACQVAFMIYGTNINIAEYTWVQLNYGSTPLPYTPYRSFKVQNSGKNLLPNTATTQTVSGVTFTVNADKSVTVNGIATSQISFAIRGDVKLTDNTQYILSGCPSGGNPSTYSLFISFSKDGAWKAETYDTGYGKSFTTNFGIYNRFDIAILIRANTTVNNLVFKPQIELGTTATTYEPYNGTEYTVPLKDTQGNFIPFRGLETAKNRIFKDADGLRKVRGHVGEYILNGSTNVVAGISTTANGLQQVWTGSGKVPNVKITGSALNKKAYCTHFISANNWNVPNTFFLDDNGNFALYFPANYFSNFTVAEVNNWLLTHNVCLYYELATPTITTLHADAQAVLNQMEQMQDGQTVIYGMDAVAPSLNGKYYKGAKSSEFAKKAETAKKAEAADMLGDELPSYYLSDDYTATIGTTWTGTVAPFTQIITVNGLTANDVPIIDLITSDSYTTAESENKAWGNIIDITTSANSLTIRAKKRITIPLNIRIKVVR